MSIKYEKGKWTEVGSILNNYNNVIKLHEFKEIGFTGIVAITSGKFTKEHSDPFDCMIASQAIHNDFTLMSRDKIFQHLGVKCAEEY